MSRKAEIQNAYKYLGKEATFYDGMITCSTPIFQTTLQTALPGMAEQVIMPS